MSALLKKPLALVTVLLIGLLAATGQPQAAEPADELHVLFIGNSLTYVNDLPKMVTELARAGNQKPLHHEQETPGGCTLERHWKHGKALEKLQSCKWDFVVLQDYSTAPLLKRSSMFEYGKKFDEAIKKQGAKTVLYMTWAMQDLPGDQAAISQAYLDLSKEIQAKVVPVGNAWAAALRADKNLVLHQKDKKHPSPAGTYLAACVFYGTLYGKSPEGLPGKIGNLTDAEAHELQASAWKQVQESEKLSP